MTLAAGLVCALGIASAAAQERGAAENEAELRAIYGAYQRAGVCAEFEVLFARADLNAILDGLQPLADAIQMPAASRDLIWADERLVNWMVMSNMIRLGRGEAMCQDARQALEALAPGITAHVGAAKAH